MKVMRTRKRRTTAKPLTLAEWHEAWRPHVFVDWNRIIGATPAPTNADTTARGSVVYLHEPLVGMLPR